VPAQESAQDQDSQADSEGGSMRRELKRGEPRERKRENRGDSLPEHDHLKGFRILGARRAPGTPDDGELGPEGPQDDRPEQGRERPGKWQRLHGLRGRPNVSR